MKLKLSHFTKTVTTAGTRVQLTTNTVKTPAISIQALRGNTNVVYVGNSTVSSTTHFISLAAGGTVVLDAEQYGLAGAHVDPSGIWLDSAVSGEGVMVGFMDRQENE